MSRYDICVFGASGFTGQFVVEFVAKAVTADGLRWAVAGELSSSRLSPWLRYFS
jgi:short subunit dehydrogenase-like uncharacterized protein